MQDSLFSPTPETPTQTGNLQTIQVAVPKPLRQLFDYLVTKEQITRLQPGIRVKVPFGRQQLIGIVVNTDRNSAAIN